MAENSYASYSDQWGFADTSSEYAFTKYTEDSNEGVLPPVAKTNYILACKLSDKLKSALQKGVIGQLKPQIFHIQSDYDENTLHYICLRLLEMDSHCLPFRASSCHLGFSCIDI